MENEETKRDEVEKIEIDEELEIVKDVKTNETIMKEKVNDILKDLDDSDVAYRRKNLKKTIFFTIGIIIEIFVIIFIIKDRYLKKETPEETKMKVVCSNTVQNSSYDASIKMNNIYYFDKNSKVTKRENEIVYAFNNKESYDRYKSDYINTDIKNFKGIDQQSIFDDNTYIFKTKLSYDYSELKNNKEVVFKNNVFTINIPGEKETTIPIEDYETVLTTNESMNFICE